MAITRANWITVQAETWTHGPAGLTFASDVPVFMALGPGLPTLDQAGFFNQNWTSGSTGDYVGAALTASSSAAGSIIRNSIIQMGNILVPEQISSILTGNGFSMSQQEINARNIALQGAVTKWVSGFIGTGTGTAGDGAIQGMTGIITNYGLAAGQQIAGGAASTALASIDAARAACTAPGTAYILTSPKGEAVIKAQIRAGGYGSVNYLTMENFGAGQYLVYDGMPVFTTDQISSTTVSGKTDIFVFKTGPQAMQCIFPESGLFDIGPLIGVEKQAYVSRNLILHTQVAHWSPRACARIVNQTF